MSELKNGRENQGKVKEFLNWSGKINGGTKREEIKLPP